MISSGYAAPVTASKLSEISPELKKSCGDCFRTYLQPLPQLLIEPVLHEDRCNSTLDPENTRKPLRDVPIRSSCGADCLCASKTHSSDAREISSGKSQRSSAVLATHSAITAMARYREGAV